MTTISLLRLYNLLFPKPLYTPGFSFPSRIASCSFVKEITFSKKVNDFRYAIYSTNSHKKCFAKMWTGNHHDLSYHWLINEINCYRAYGGLCKGRVAIPRFMGVYQAPRQVVLLTEYIPGKNIKALPDSAAVALYRECLMFITNLPHHQLSHMGAGMFLLASPILVLQSLLKYPLSAPIILSAWWVFLAHFPALLSQNSHRSVHKDLGENILTTGKRSFIIDFQVMTQTFSFLDLINIEINHLSNTAFLTQFHRTVISQWLSSSTHQKAYSSLSAFSLLLNLGPANNFTPHGASRYLRYINKYYA